MLKKIRNVVIGVLAIFGVLFIILMLIPDDEEYADDETEYAAEEDNGSVEDIEEFMTEASGQHDEEQQTVSEESKPDEEAVPEGSEEASGADLQISDDSGNTVNVNIPASEISDKTLKFKTLTLDNKAVTQDIFKDYDLTLVHMWGTYCMPCVREMSDYAQFYKELPDNINLIGIVVDAYDGIDTNVSSADRILGDAGAEFVNIRTSDSLYDLMNSFQYVPSSVIVDKDGHIVGQIMDGAKFEQTKSKLYEYIEQ